MISVEETKPELKDLNMVLRLVGVWASVGYSRWYNQCVNNLWTKITQSLTLIDGCVIIVLFPTMKGKTIINKISDGWSLLFKQWHVTVSLACIVPRTSIQTHNSEISFVCVCLRVWMTDHAASDAVKKRSKEAAQLGRKMWTQVNRYKELLAKVFGKSWWWDFFWGSCNVIDNLLFYQFPVYLYLLFCLQYIILSAGAATLHTPSCWTEVRVRLWLVDVQKLSK